MILLSFVCLFASNLTSIFIHDKYHKFSVSLCVCVLPSSLTLRLSSTLVYLWLIANAGSIAAAIDLSTETPSRQEK